MVEENDDDVLSQSGDIENRDAENGDIAVPEDYDIDLDPTDDMRERRYLWIARVFAVFSAISLCTNIVLLIAIGNILPLNRVEPYYLTFQNKSDQIVRIKDLNVKKNDDDASYNLIEESLVREYIQLRHTVIPDINEMEKRWSSGGLLRWISDDAVYRDFNDSEYVRMMSRIADQRYSQTVSISTVNLIHNPRHWQVDFETTEMIGEARKPTTHKWTATIQIKPESMGKGSRELLYSDRLKNPLGLKVSHYVLRSSDSR